MLKGRKPKTFVGTPPTLMSDFFYKELVIFLRARSVLLAPKDLAEEWNQRWENDFDPEFVNEHQIRYLQLKLGLALTPDARKQLKGPKRREAQRRVQISQTIQSNTDSGLLEERQSFLQLRDDFRLTHPEHPEHECPHCKESLPLDQKFFTRYKKKGAYYFDKAHCLLCRSEKRRKAYRAEKSGQELPQESTPLSRIQKREMELERIQREALSLNPAATMRNCLRCEKPRLLEPRFFQLNAGKLSYTCVICIAERRSKKRKAKRRGTRTPSAKRRRRDTNRLIHQLKYPEWKAERLAEAERLLTAEPLTRVRLCPGCDTKLPVAKKWFRMSIPRGGEEEVVTHHLCVLCLCAPERKETRQVR